MADNIISFAAVQDEGWLPSGTEDALALIYAERATPMTLGMRLRGRAGLLADGARWNFDTTLHAFDRPCNLGRELAPECAVAGCGDDCQDRERRCSRLRAPIRRLALTAVARDGNHLQLVTPREGDSGYPPRPMTWPPAWPRSPDLA